MEGRRDATGAGPPSVGGESKPHSEECRKRIEEAMKQDQDGGGRSRWERNDDRIHEHLARKMEEASQTNEDREVLNPKSGRGRVPLRSSQSDGVTVKIRASLRFEAVHRTDTLNTATKAADLAKSNRIQ